MGTSSTPNADFLGNYRERAYKSRFCAKVLLDMTLRFSKQINSSTKRVCRTKYRWR